MSVIGLRDLELNMFDAPELNSQVLCGLERQEIGFIVSAPEMGKGYLCLSIAYEVASGEKLLGVTPNDAKPKKVLYWPIEDRLRQVSKRVLRHKSDLREDVVSKLDENIGLFDKNESLFISRNQENSAVIEELIQHAKHFDLLIIDTLRESMGCLDEVEDDVIAKLLLQRIAKEANCALLLTHHLTKASSRGDEIITSVSGSGYSQALANSRLQFGLQKEKKDGGLKLSHIKGNNLEIEDRINGMPLSWSSGGVLARTGYKFDSLQEKEKSVAPENKARRRSQKPIFDDSEPKELTLRDEFGGEEAKQFSYISEDDKRLFAEKLKSRPGSQ